MATNAEPLAEGPSRFVAGFRVQKVVVGALIMREIHTRYGRENVGYLWLILEPLMLGTVIGALHAGHATHYGSDISAVALGLLGYTLFIMFRGIFNRAEGAMEANLPLLYHRSVSVFDVMLSRALLEAAGTFVSFVILMSLVVSIGLAPLPARPLYLAAGIVILFWFSFALSLIVVAGTHENRTLGRLVHPISYFMMPLSGAFFLLQWIPMPYREWLSWFQLVQIFELIRYGYFRSALYDYVDVPYLVGSCMFLTLVGLLAIRVMRSKMHLR